MTRKEAERLTHQQDALTALGFTHDEAEALRRISMTLHRWSEQECNGEIERDGENGDGRPFRSSAATGGKHHAYRINDKERGALRRLAAIVNARNARLPLSQPTLHVNGTDVSVRGSNAGIVTYYVQGDPRGAALYILRPGDVPDGKDADSYYSRGIVVY